MTNDIPQSKLDEAIKNTLSQYEVSDESADWSRMERMLDAAPKSGSFKWSYAAGALILLIVAATALLTWPSSSQKTPEVTPPVVNKPPVTEPQRTAPAQPAPAPATTTAPAADTPPPVPTAAAIPATADAQAGRLKTADTKEKATMTRRPTKPLSANPDDDIILQQKVIGMGQDPVFGDMIDPSKGIIGETKETSETKKAATTQKGPVAWDAIMMPHVNPDSLRKYRDQKDSLKNH